MVGKAERVFSRERWRKRGGVGYGGGAPVDIVPRSAKQQRLCAAVRPRVVLEFALDQKSLQHLAVVRS
tara:strand:- start:23 stop:226 length:204 start_codon:yes stop_codon:yes gene_type:complete